MANKKRNYEVSIWTLQDEFITVLKPFNVESKGQIEQPKMVIKDDGTEEFTFSIPMYLYFEKTQEMNPLWTNVIDGTIVQDTRKVKVTFNKYTEVQKTFEFLIISITDRHEGDKLYCDAKCEGIAFHELGKKGYKISLSSDDFYADDYEWFSSGSIGDQPLATIDYWVNEKMGIPQLPSNGYIDPNQWYYKVDMNWGSYEGNRVSSKIYEDAYVKSWNDNYTPKEIADQKEKERLVDLEESNIYNLTQKLAETFGVFCRYDYEYDDNLHVIQRVIVFYNNYMKEEEGYLDLTYPYSASGITRTRDSNDLTTKMYVRPVTDDQSASGLITIMDVAANKSKEDYLLNFDYLAKIGNITSEQQQEVSNYEAIVGSYNEQLIAIEGPLNALQGKVPELEAAITTYTNSIQLDKERISNANDLLNALTDNTGVIEITSSNPRTAVLIQSSKTDGENSYYIRVSDQGVLPETVKIYRTYNFTTGLLSNEITTGTPEYDEFGNVIKISSLYKGELDKSTVYVIYKYNPQLYYDRVINTWKTRLAKDEGELSAASAKLETTNTQITWYETEYANILNAKKKYIADFEKMMGPAIRESYWQPDEYTDYGDNYIDAFSFSANGTSVNNSSSELTELIWDTTTFSDELNKADYEITVNQNKIAYPIIDLTNYLDQYSSSDNFDINKLSFMFYDFDFTIEDYAPVQSPRNMKIFSVGSTAKCGFVKKNNVIKPVLIITGFSSLSSDSQSRLSNPYYSPTLGVMTTTIAGSEITTLITNSRAVASTDFIHIGGQLQTNVEGEQLYYPRIKVKSLALKTSNDMLMVNYVGTLLANYEDYYVLSRDDSTLNNNTFTSDAAYYITLKPEVMVQNYYHQQDGVNVKNLQGRVQFKFNISNADTAIYLDAIKVLKENAWPKVSYTITPSVVDEDFLYTLYNKLCRICNINDLELKFENVQGYISELEIDCNYCENDKIEIKNYKTKFEDLFSSIVAQTEAMQKRAYTINAVNSMITASGNLNGEVFL